MKNFLLNRTLRRAIGGTCMVFGGLLMWLAPDAAILGIVLFAAGILLEIAGITLERSDTG